jgi:WD40 repeat protein
VSVEPMHNRSIGNDSNEIKVRRVHDGQVMHTIHNVFSNIWCMSSVPGQPDLHVTGGHDGQVHLWDIGKGNVQFILS